MHTSASCNIYLLTHITSAKKKIKALRLSQSQSYASIELSTQYISLVLNKFHFQFVIFFIPYFHDNEKSGDFRDINEFKWLASGCGRDRQKL